MAGGRAVAQRQPLGVVVGEAGHARGVGPHQRAQRQIEADRLDRLHERRAGARIAEQDHFRRQQGHIDGGGGLGVIDAGEHGGAVRRHGGDQALDRLGLIAPGSRVTSPSMAMPLRPSFFCKTRSPTASPRPVDAAR